MHADVRWLEFLEHSLEQGVLNICFRIPCLGADRQACKAIPDLEHDRERESASLPGSQLQSSLQLTLLFVHSQKLSMKCRCLALSKGRFLNCAAKPAMGLLAKESTVDPMFIESASRQPRIVSVRSN